MGKRLKKKGMFRMLGKRAKEIPDHRTGENEQYSIEDAVLSGMSVFYTQSPSFLSWQQDMEKEKGKSNAQSLFGIVQIPSVEQIRNLLDPVNPSYLGEMFWDVYKDLSSGANCLITQVQEGPELSVWMVRSITVQRILSVHPVV